MGEACVALPTEAKMSPCARCNRTTWADALHQAGEAERARALFEEAEAVQEGQEPRYPQLYSLQGYKYCDLLLAQGRAIDVRERAAGIPQVARPFRCAARHRP